MRHFVTEKAAVAASVGLFVLILAVQASSQTLTATTQCPPFGTTISIAGSSTAVLLTNKWASRYMELCPAISILVEGGGSTAGVTRVCNNAAFGLAVDIGQTSRKWHASEGATTNAWRYTCLQGDTSRVVTQIDVAMDGLSIVTIQGRPADTCITLMGGLTLHQLRWMYSSYSSDQLLATGWDANAISNSDGRSDTHLWSELNPACASEEIKLYGPDSLSGTYEYFLQQILTDKTNGESVDLNRLNEFSASAENEGLMQYLLNDGNAISFVDFPYYYANRARLVAASIYNQEFKAFVAPNLVTVSDGSYAPLSRRIYMNLLESSLNTTRPFMVFILSDEGSSLAQVNGYVPIPDYEKIEVLSRTSASQANISCGPETMKMIKRVLSSPSNIMDSSVADITSTPTEALTSVPNDVAVTTAPVVLAVTPAPADSLSILAPSSIPDTQSPSSVSTPASNTSGFHNLQCGPNGTLSMAGSTTIFPIAKKWAKRYMEECPGINVTVEEGGSTVGAGKVCNDPSYGSAVDIGEMSRGWKASEAFTENGFKYGCLIGDTTRSVIQVEIAIDGVTIASASGGAGDNCLQALGGVTIDQLRWMYSSYSIANLTATGWDPKSLRNSDGVDSTHFWSELANDPACPEVEIKISGPGNKSGTFDFFLENVLRDYAHGETFALNRPSENYVGNEDDYTLVDFLVANNDAISYFGFAYYYTNKDRLTAAAVRDDKGLFVVPTPETVANGEYNPLSRPIFMNLYDNAASLEMTLPFFQFGLSIEGTDLVKSTGYVPIPEYLKITMLSRVGANGGVALESITCGHHNATFTFAGSSAVFSIAQVWANLYGDACGNVITVEHGDSAEGAARVCGNPVQGSAVQIGGVSRDWKQSESTTQNGWYHTCLFPGDTTRSVIQIDVAIESLTIATAKGGVADGCIKALGGLSLDQLRWIYSSYNNEKLEKSGWNSMSIPNSDNNDATHLWSEFLDDIACPSTQIRIAGHGPESCSYECFEEMVFIDSNSGEGFDEGRPFGFFNSENNKAMVDYITENTEAITYFSFAEYNDLTDVVSAVAIVNDNGQYIVPSSRAIQDGTYNSMSRRVYMNVLDTQIDLANIQPFFNFGFSGRGSFLVELIGYSPIPPWERAVMSTRLKTEGFPVLSDIKCGPPGRNITFTASTSLLSVAQPWAAVYKMACDIEITFDSGKSRSGTRRVCADPALGGPVDVSDMSRGWQESDASVVNEYEYQCPSPGDTSRRIIQIEVASDGVVVATKRGGIADICIGKIGGLTVSQLRWIFSDFRYSELSAVGWDSSSVPNSDGDDNTHLWSELNVACPAIEIKIAGQVDLSGTFEPFVDPVLASYTLNETFDTGRPDGFYSSATVEEVADFILANEDAISYFSFAFYSDNHDDLAAVPVKNSEGSYVLPTTLTIDDQSYNPLSRRLFMSVLNYEDILESIRPFLKFGLNNENLTAAIGLVPLAAAQKTIMMDRLSIEGVLRPGTTALSDSHNNRRGGSNGMRNPATIVGILGGIAGTLCMIGVLYVRNRYHKYKKENMHDYGASIPGARSAGANSKRNNSFVSLDQHNGTILSQENHWNQEMCPPA